MSDIIEIGIGGVFELPYKMQDNAAYLNDPNYWIYAKPFENAEETYRKLLEWNFPLVFHIYAKNQQTANAQALAIKQVLGDMQSKARYEGGVGYEKIPFQSFCCVDDDIPYLYKSGAEIKAIIDRPYNIETTCLELEYRNEIRRMYRLKEPTQMTQLAIFMKNRKELFTP